MHGEIACWSAIDDLVVMFSSVARNIHISSNGIVQYTTIRWEVDLRKDPDTFDS